MEPGITAARWLGPAQEYSRQWISGRDPSIADTTIETFASAAWAALREE